MKVEEEECWPMDVESGGQEKQLEGDDDCEVIEDGLGESQLGFDDEDVTCQTVESAEDSVLSPISKMDASGLSMGSTDEFVVLDTDRQVESDEENEDEAFEELKSNVEDLVDRFERVSQSSAVDPLVICEVARRQERRDKFRYKKLSGKYEVADTEVDGKDFYIPHFWELEESAGRKRTPSEAKKLRIHISEVGQWDSLSCNKPVEGHVYLGTEVPEGRQLCDNCLRCRPELAFLK